MDVLVSPDLRKKLLQCRGICLRARASGLADVFQFLFRALLRKDKRIVYRILDRKSVV